MTDRSLFGTDGIRGVANDPPLDPESLTRLGCILGWLPVEYPGSFVYPFGQDDPGDAGEHLYDVKKPRTVVGRDPRSSGPMIESALVAGLTASGSDVIKCGVIPTPGVSYLTHKYNAHLGISISASHNPPEYNGIKLFSPNGFKFSDHLEDKIDGLYFGDKPFPPVPVNKDRMGTIIRKEKQASDDYLDFLRESVKSDLSGLTICVDSAHGAAADYVDPLFSDLGVDVHHLSDEPDGMNINQDCGTADLDNLVSCVTDREVDAGIALDGDADRALVVDENGEIRDGDELLACFGLFLKDANQLKDNRIVGTVMTNHGLVQFLSSRGIQFDREAVGDRNIQKKLYDDQLSLGGEQSGHIILYDRSPTGDGLQTALFLLDVMAQTGNSASELLNIFDPFPQVLENVEVDEKPPLDSMDEVQTEIRKWEEELGDRGRILLRYSGTEPVCRVMVEGKDEEEIREIANELARVVSSSIEKKIS